MVYHRWKLKKKESEARSLSDELNKPATVDKGLEMYEQELYDDASSVMATTEEVTINIPGPRNYNYSQVDVIRLIPTNVEKFCLTRMHSSRMRTDRQLTVSWRIPVGHGVSRRLVVVCPGGGVSRGWCVQ